ncbi:separase [Sporobolomyces salmoneus]|uniref:separase n=1 Tax=Sporobolomyces salmoneus TaxID=183962 RepID=UPI0031758581
MPTAMRPPPAPSKTRALPHRTARTTRTAASPTEVEPSLVDNLASLALDTAPKRPTRITGTASTTKRVPSGSTSTKPLARSTAQNKPLPSTSRLKCASETPTELPEESKLSIDERAKQASATINASLATLSNLAKSGYRAEQPSAPASQSSAATPTPSSRSSSSARPGTSTSKTATGRTNGKEKENAESVAKEAGKAFRVLRELGRDNLRLGNKRVSIEGMAGRFIAELIQVQLYRYALIELSAMRNSILSWYTPLSGLPSIPPPTSPLLAHATSLVVPLPPQSYFSPPTLSETLSTSIRRPTLQEIVPLVLALQQSLLSVLFKSSTLSSSSEGQRLRVEKLEQVLRNDGQGRDGGPLDWNRMWENLSKEQSMDEKEKALTDQKLDATLLGLFQAITNGTSSAEDKVAPELLLNLRIQALLCFCSASTFPSSPSQLAAFHIQHRKILLRYGRSAQGVPYSYSSERIAKEAGDAFTRVMQSLEGLHSSHSRAGAEWTELCQVVLHLARKANDVSLVSNVSKYLPDSDSPSSSPSPPLNAVPTKSTGPEIPPASQASSLVASLHRLLALFDLFTKSSDPTQAKETQTLLEALRRTPAYFGRAAHLLSLSTSSTPNDSNGLPRSRAIELDHSLHQIRSIFSRFIRTPPGKSNTLLRSDELVTLAGSSKPIPLPTDPALSEIHKLVRDSLNAFVSVVERQVASQESRPEKAEEDTETKDRNRLMRSKGVETLILLAHDSLSISDRTTHSTTYAYLSRALPLLRSRPPSPDSSETSKLDLDLDYPIHSIASVFYNIGARLFSASRGDGAVRFAEQSCLLTRETLMEFAKDDREENNLVEGMQGLGVKDSEGVNEEKMLQEAKRAKERREDREKIRNDLEKNAGRRWELLGLAQHVIDDKKAAHGAYLAAILAQPPTLLEQLSVDASQRSLSHLIETYSPLVKLVDRATRLSTFDLLLSPEQVSFGGSFASSTTSLSPDLRGILLEFQLHALDQVSEQTSSQRAASAVLASLESVYSASEFPLRRARVLVRTMQQLCVGSHVAQDLKPAALAAEIDELCSSPAMTGRDGALSAFSAQHLSLSHLFLGFHAHHSRLTSSSSLVEAEAKQSLSILRKALEGDLPASPSVPIAAQSKVTFQASPVRSPIAAVVIQPAAATRRRTTRAAAATPAKVKTTLKTPQTSRTLAASRRGAGAVQEQVTPPEKDPLERIGQFKPTPAKKGENLKSNLDDPVKVYRLLETMTNLLGTLGHSLLKMSFLKFLRRLSAKLPSENDTAFVTASSFLAHEYLLLGKTMRAGTVLAQAEHRTSSGALSNTSSEILRLLIHAEYFASIGNHDRATRSYESAMTTAESINSPDATASVSTKIVEMTLILQRVALASSVYSWMLHRRGDLARSLAPALQAMRLCDRALNNIARLEPVKKPTSDASSTFNAQPNDHVTPLNDLASSPRNPYQIALGGAHAGLAWQLADQLALSILRVSTLHLVRGSPKDAEFYASQTIDLAQNLGSQRLIARATALRAEVKILLRKWEEAGNDLEQVELTLGDANCAEAIEVRRLGADLLLRNSLHQEAYSSLLEAQKHLEVFVKCAAEAELSQTPVRRSISAKSLSPAQQRSASKVLSPFNPFSSPGARSGSDADWVLPASHAFIVRMQVALLRLQNKTDESQALLRRLAKLSSSEEDKADELLLLASLHLQDMLSRCTSDPVLGMLPDSVLSIPAMSISLSTIAVKIGTPRTGPTILNSLKDVDGLLVRAAAYSASRSQPNKLRELSLITGTMRTFHANVGKPSKRAAVSVAHLLDLGTAVTLRREMLDAIDHKLAQTIRQDDLLWPAPSVEEEGDEHPSSDRRLLVTMRDRYRLETPEPALTDPSMSSLLPPKWTTISLHLTSERDNLIIVRHRKDSEPVVFKLPLDRLARREGEDESFTYDDAINELNNIIASTKLSSQNAKHVKTREEREAWWKERQDLDNRLKDLLQMIEDNWLGAFKSVFCDVRAHPAESFASFRSRIERILKRGIVRAANEKKSTRFKLNDAIVECVAALPATSREEDLEDLFFFMTEAFQFSGVPVACDETDVDQVVVDLREALEELHGTKSAPKRPIDPDEHTFLVLDKDLAAFPWESLPCLLGRSVSRLPSLSFLRDRLDLASANNSSHEMTVNAARAAFVLNPGGDLAATQRTFEPWLQKKTNEANWDGVIGRAPLEEEVKSALASKDLFLYFGHGGAEQYIRRRVIRHLPKCAVTMLWGCSSGILKDQGDFDPVGTPYNYIIAGCPALVANLWDVTDKDIDKFAQSVFEKSGIIPSSASPSPISLTSAVAQSRNVCNLRYLNGAAPVVYGIPVRFAHQA